MTYSDVFGGATVPPSQDKLNTVSITANTTMYWPNDYSGTGISAADLIEISSDAARNITLPAASSASKGAGFVINNVGSYTLSAFDGASGALTTISTGVAKYFYIEDNSTVAGTWRVITWGTGTSSADATALVEAGLTVLSGKLATGIEVVESSASMAITSSHRAKLVVNTGGAVTFTFAEASTLGSEYYVVVRNSGSGTLTLATTSSQTIDGVTTVDIAPEETATIVRNGTSFYSFGQGRSMDFSFTQTNYNDSRTTITVTSAEAGGYMLNFNGNPASAVTVTLPSVASIYYINNATSTSQQLTFRTAGTGSTTIVTANTRSIIFCDSLNVVSAQSPATTAAVSFVDGSASNPSVTFSADPDTGIYRVGANTIGISVNGTNLGNFSTSGWTGPISGVPAAYFSTISSNVQDQIDAKMSTDTDLTAIAALSGTGVLSHTGSGTWAERTITAGTGITVTNGGGVAGNPTIEVTASTYQPLDAQLTTLAGITAQQATDLAAVSTFMGTVLNDADAATARTTFATMFNTTVAKTANYTVISTDRGKLIDATSGTWTLTLTAVATLGAAYSIAVRNSGTGVITIDPDGTETIDGVTSIDLAAGESCIVVANYGATAWKTIGRASGVAGTLLQEPTLLTSGTSHTLNAATTHVIVEMVGGGGGGGEDNVEGGGGGGAGCYLRTILLSTASASSLTYAIGAGGAAATVPGFGGSGGNSTITINSVTFTAYGGAGGGGGNSGGASWSGGAGGDADTNTSLRRCDKGETGYPSNNTFPYGGNGGSSAYAVGGATGAAGGIGAGGGGSSSGGAYGGAGGAGQIFIWEYRL